MPPKKVFRDKTWSMYPQLHSDIARYLEADNLTFEFHKMDDTSDCIKEYDTNITGRFHCTNQHCPSKGWSSKKVAITIRLYKGRRYNARVYYQRCQRCDWVSRPELHATYAERVAYRLQKWSGIQMERPPFSSQSKGPHLSNLCEGCRNGHCSERTSNV